MQGLISQKNAQILTECVFIAPTMRLAAGTSAYPKAMFAAKTRTRMRLLVPRTTSAVATLAHPRKASVALKA